MTETEGSPEPRLNPIFTRVTTLRICGLLAPITEEDFATVRDALELTDSNLSKQLAVLAGAGYVTHRRGALAGRRKVWVALTPAGRKALRQHIAILRQIEEYL